MNKMENWKNMEKCKANNLDIFILDLKINALVDLKTYYELKLDKKNIIDNGLDSADNIDKALLSLEIGYKQDSELIKNLINAIAKDGTSKLIK
jgi:hypothetical protein